MQHFIEFLSEEYTSTSKSIAMTCNQGAAEVEEFMRGQREAVIKVLDFLMESGNISYRAELVECGNMKCLELISVLNYKVIEPDFNVSLLMDTMEKMCCHWTSPIPADKQVKRYAAGIFLKLCDIKAFLKEGGYE